MKPIDFLKAAGVALALLILNIVVVVVAVVVYSQLIEPGQPSEFYDEAAQRIAPWCTRTIGLAFFFSAGWLLTRRRPDRNGLLFAALFSLFYFILDAASVGFAGVASVEFLLSMLANALAALAGAYVAVVRMGDQRHDAQQNGSAESESGG